VTTGEAASVAAGAVAAVVAVRAMPGAVRVRRSVRYGRRPAPPPAGPADLRMYERMLRLAASSAGEAHHRLAPALRDIAARRLAAGDRIDLYADPEAARARVSAPTWDLIRPDRPAPSDRHGRGPALADLEAAIAELEELGT
jgi:hypothetical protein